MLDIQYMYLFCVVNYFVIFFWSVGILRMYAMLVHFSFDLYDFLE